jgi:hypothetical protein
MRVTLRDATEGAIISVMLSTHCNFVVDSQWPPIAIAADRRPRSIKDRITLAESRDVAGTASGMSTSGRQSIEYTGPIG